MTLRSIVNNLNDEAKETSGAEVRYPPPHGTHGAHVNARYSDKFLDTAEAKPSGLLCMGFIVHFNKVHAVFNMAQSACAVYNETS